jgi:hypothetical protein
MTIYYKSYRIVNGKPKLVVTDEDCNIVQSPNKEQIKIAILEYRDHYKRCRYKETKCCKCDSTKTYMKGPEDPLWYICECGKKDFTGNICDICYGKTRSPAGWRYGQLDASSSPGKGFIGVQIIAKTYGLEDCNIKMSSFNFYIDLSKHSEYGYIEVKTATLNIKNREWYFSKFHERNFDNLLALCMDSNKPWKDVKMAYMTPWEDAINRMTIKITENPARKPWYYDFRIDEKPFNDTYHNMKLDNCKILRKNR